MTAEAKASPASEKLHFLASTVLLEAKYLLQTDGRLFVQPMDIDRVLQLASDIELGERVDAFVGRFGRLQDTLADKLLPALLAWKAEPLGPAIDNLARAERLGWIGNVEIWLEARRQRNRMVHEYGRDPAELAATLNLAHATVPVLVAAATDMAALVEPTLKT